MLIVDMVHDEEDDQEERLINEGKRLSRSRPSFVLCSLLISTWYRVQDMEEEQPVLIRHDSWVSGFSNCGNSNFGLLL